MVSDTPNYVVFCSAEVKYMTRGIGGQSPARLEMYLKGQHYPARKPDLVDTARANKAPQEILELIEGLPDEEFGGPQDVMKGYGEERREEDRDR